MAEVSQKFIQTIEKLNSTNYAKYLKSSGTFFYLNLYKLFTRWNHPNNSNFKIDFSHDEKGS